MPHFDRKDFPVLLKYLALCFLVNLILMSIMSHLKDPEPFTSERLLDLLSGAFGTLPAGVVLVYLLVQRGKEKGR